MLHEQDLRPARATPRKEIPSDITCGVAAPRLPNAPVVVNGATPASACFAPRFLGVRGQGSGVRGQSAEGLASAKGSRLSLRRERAGGDLAWNRKAGRTLAALPSPGGFSLLRKPHSSAFLHLILKVTFDCNKTPAQ